MANPHPNTSGLIQFSSTNQPKNKNGRKPSILKKYMRSIDLSHEDYEKINRFIFSLSLDELTELMKDTSQPAIVIALAKAVFNDIRYGKLGNVNEVAKRAGVYESKEPKDSSSPGTGDGDQGQFHTYEFPIPDEIE